MATPGFDNVKLSLNHRTSYSYVAVRINNGIEAVLYNHVVIDTLLQDLLHEHWLLNENRFTPARSVRTLRAVKCLYLIKGFRA